VHLADPDPSPGQEALFAADLAAHGYVMNLTRLWSHLPATKVKLFEVVDELAEAAGLTFRQRGVLVAATASTIGDSYCALAWGTRLAAEAGADAAAGVVACQDGGLDDPADRALATWARRLLTDPTATAPDDLQPLRDAGFDDARLLAVTAFVALRRAFSTVNAALGARPDAELVAAAPPQVVDAVTYGRPPDP
jgi:alkylhydroperoxidase family enzyme